MLVAAVGDISLGGDVRDVLTRYGSGFVFEPCRQMLARADLRFGNLECVITPGAIEAGAGKSDLWLPESLADGLWAAGFGVLNLAQNHILDFGPEAAIRTAELCRAHGVTTIGLARTQAQARRLEVVKAAGLRVGFLGYVEDVPGLERGRDPGPAYLQPEVVLDDVRAARAGGLIDVLVVSIHADLEFVDFPAPHRVRLARQLVEAGADVVLCHHPHVPQGIERHGPGLIAYSLGNFIFAVSTDPYLRNGSVYTNRSFVLQIELDKNGYVGHQIEPLRIGELHRPEPLAAGAEREALLSHIEAISADLADEAALARHWSETAWRYLGINVNWLVNRAHEKDIGQWAEKFFCRLSYDENLPWLRQIISELTEKMPPRP